MTLAAFRDSPWQTSHAKYKESAFAITPAPEYASSEVLVSSLYRTIGFEGASEGSIPQAGRDLDKRMQKLRDRKESPPAGATISPDAWNTVLHGVLESPKLPNQSSRRFLQISPLVPETALFSGSARLSRNSWNPGPLIRRMAWLGSPESTSATELWTRLFEAMSVDAQDDIFGRWLHAESVSWTTSSTGASWRLAPVAANDVASLSSEDFTGLLFPARQFAKDLVSIIAAKHSMTRRQWVSLLEAVLRLGAVAHVTWLCDVHARIWGCVSAVLAGQASLAPEAARRAIFPDEMRYMTYGSKALLAIKDKASAYLAARLGLNAVLWTLEEVGEPYDGSISSSRDVAGFCEHVRKNRPALLGTGLPTTIAETSEREARALLCKGGIGKNIEEFARHVLGQRLTANELLRGYDQGFVLRKKGSSSSAPWVVSLGPVSVLALVHCALAGVAGPRSIHRLAQHLGSYGIVVDKHEIGRNDLGHQLRMLGLVLDSPDAESGMLLLPPFPSKTPAAASATA